MENTGPDFQQARSQSLQRLRLRFRCWAVDCCRSEQESAI